MEAGLGFFVALDKGEFVGRKTSGGAKSQRRPQKIDCLQDDRKITRRRGRIIRFGRTTPTSARSPAAPKARRLGIGIGMGYVTPALAKPETQIEIEIRGKYSPALVVPKPIYQPVKQP